MLTVSKILFGFAMGIFFTMLVTSSALYWKSPSYYRGLVMECQKDLPRTEHCILIAVPEENKE